MATYDDSHINSGHKSPILKLIFRVGQCTLQYKCKWRDGKALTLYDILGYNRLIAPLCIQNLNSRLNAHVTFLLCTCNFVHVAMRLIPGMGQTRIEINFISVPFQSCCALVSSGLTVKPGSSRRVIIGQMDASKIHVTDRLFTYQQSGRQF